ncbi:LysR family transcriptional regulator [Bradyrhizobium sp.]|uniref:LysR family transcriptional regulator n=1 Tax=Bradyrhizobium sp. TaxID=376 RepID=UPI0039E6A750
MERLPDLRKIEIFLAVSRHLSFRRAAEELSISQPVLTRAIQQLETALGFKLFERTTRRVSLTDAGKVLIEESSKAFAQLARGIRAARLTSDGHAGTLMVGYSALATHGPMAELLMQFGASEPNVNTELHLRSSFEQINALVSGELDAGFLMSVACKETVPHTELFRERLVILASRLHPIAQRTEVALKDLSKDVFVFGREGRWNAFRSVALNVCMQAGYLPTIADEADEFPILVRQVSLRKGITLYGASVREILPPDVIALPITDEYADFGISLAWRGGHTPPILRRFVDFVVERCSHDFQIAMSTGERTVA